MQARSKARTENSEANLTTLDFLAWARYQLSQESGLRVKMAGQSMSPTIEDNELIFIEPVAGEQGHDLSHIGVARRQRNG